MDYYRAEGTGYRGWKVVSEDGETITPKPDMTRDEADLFALHMNVAYGVGLVKGKLGQGPATIGETKDAYLASQSD